MTCNSRTTARSDRASRRARAGASALPLALAALLGCAALGAAARPASAREWPAPAGYVSDFARVVDPASADSIAALARALAGRVGSELAVVTLPDLGGDEIEPVATDLFATWGVGRKSENDGVLILLAVAERRVRIEVGYGLEGILPDGRCGGIIRQVMAPELSANRFGPGLLAGARAVASAIAAEKGVTLSEAAGVTAPPLGGGDDGDGGGGFPLAQLVFLAIVFILLSRIARLGSRRRRGGGFGGFGGPFWGGMGGFGGFGGFGGGSGGGGFGGFGGGMSGGGGASGRF